MHITEHEEHCIKEFGKPFTEVHQFLDQFARKYGMSLAHRLVLHHRLGMELVGVLMGPDAREAAKLHILDDVRRLPAGPEWFLKLPAYQPTSGQEDALESDLLAMVGYAPDFNATWARMSRTLKCGCGYPGPMQTTREGGHDSDFRCPWCAAKKTERFDLLRFMAVGQKSHNAKLKQASYAIEDIPIDDRDEFEKFMIGRGCPVVKGKVRYWRQDVKEFYHVKAGGKTLIEMMDTKFLLDLYSRIVKKGNDKPRLH